MESKLGTYPPAFLDRGIPDVIAYYKFRGREPPGWIEGLAKLVLYDDVFVLDVLPFYRGDEARKESEEEARRIGKIIEEVYRDFGYEPKIIPCLEIEDRLEMILNYVNEYIPIEA